jgi:hypothetical protein
MHQFDAGDRNRRGREALGLELKSIEIDHHRSEPRWIFARFVLNVAKALAEATPVQTSPREGEILDPLCNDDATRLGW